jgi:hypothetical protein
MKRIPSLVLVSLTVVACGGSPDSTEDPSQSDDELRRASSFASSEKELFSLFAGGPQRGGDVYSVTSTTPIVDALHGYVNKKYSDDKDIRDGYTFKSNAGWNTDTSEVGTVSDKDAWSVIANDVSERSKAEQAKAKSAFDALVKAGAVFGYDAGEESGCAAPTDFLLVIDPKGKKVYTIELTPCDES